MSRSPDPTRVHLKLAFLCGVAGSMLLVTEAAQAALDYSVDVGAAHTDNVTRVPDQEIDATAATAGLNLIYTRQGSRLDADVEVDGGVLHYFDGPFDTQVVGGLNALFDLALVPDRFSWSFQDTFGQARLDPFEPVTLANQENINYFTTGPTFMMNLGTRSSLQLTGRYSKTNYEDSLLDDTRKRYGIGFLVPRSDAVTLSLNGVVEEIEFDDIDSLGADYDRRAAFLGYDARLARTTIAAQVGYNEIDTVGGDKEGAPLLRLEAIRTLSPSTSLTLIASSQYSNSGDALRDSEVGPLDTAPGARPTSSADPFENRELSLDWTFARARTSLLLGASLVEDEYRQQTSLNRDAKIYRATFERLLRPTLRFRVFGQYTDEAFETADFDSKERRLGGAFTFNATSTVALTLSYENFDRSASQAAREYSENRALLTFAYTSPVGPRAAGPRPAGRSGTQPAQPAR